MVFDPKSAPREPAAFFAWYEQQAEWEEGHTYDDPSVTTAQLRTWFMDMIAAFPALNGPFAEPASESPRRTDYCIGRCVIYATFAWSQVEPAYKSVRELATKHGVGFFDASSLEGGVYFPDGLEFAAAPEVRKTKPWWRFW